MTSRSVIRLSKWINSPLVQLPPGILHWSVRVRYTRYLSLNTLNIGLRQHHSDIRQSGKSGEVFLSLPRPFDMTHPAAGMVVLFPWSHSLKYMRLASYKFVSLNIVDKNCTTSAQMGWSLTIQCDLWRFIEPHMEGGHKTLRCWLLVSVVTTDTVNKIPLQWSETLATHGVHVRRLQFSRYGDAL